ncbi:DUF433 domain-containing protein [Candidatus Aerophobetes bacterium]|nr:DUF433 domain-containing protein [Candidatus Aerophobetes bacterium]
MGKIDDRIAINTKVCHGKPHIKGTRIMVSQILDLLSARVPPQKIISEDYFPDLTLQDIYTCIDFANRAIKNEEMYLAQS